MEWYHILLLVVYFLPGIVLACGVVLMVLEEKKKGLNKLSGTFFYLYLVGVAIWMVLTGMPQLLYFLLTCRVLRLCAYPIRMVVRVACWFCSVFDLMRIWFFWFFVERVKMKQRRDEFKARFNLELAFWFAFSVQEYEEIWVRSKGNYGFPLLCLSGIIKLDVGDVVRKTRLYKMARKADVMDGAVVAIYPEKWEKEVEEEIIRRDKENPRMRYSVA